MLDVRQSLQHLFVSIGIFWLVSVGADASALLIPGNLSVGPAPAVDGTGLNGQFYFIVTNNATTHTAIDTIVATTNPLSTFHSTLVDYPAGVENDEPSVSIASFLDAPDKFTLSGFAGTGIQNRLVRLSGYLNVLTTQDTSPGGLIDIQMALGSTGSSRLRIGSLTAIDNGGIHPFTLISETMRFEKAGLYPIEIIFYPRGNIGDMGIEWFSSIPGGPDSGAPIGTVGIVPTKVLYSSAPNVPTPAPIVTHPVPEPGVLSLLLTGCGVLAAFRKRHF